MSIGITSGSRTVICRVVQSRHLLAVVQFHEILAIDFDVRETIRLAHSLPEAAEQPPSAVEPLPGEAALQPPLVDVDSCLPQVVDPCSKGLPVKHSHMVHDEARFLAGLVPVRPGNGLHKCVVLHGLVEVDR